MKYSSNLVEDEDSDENYIELPMIKNKPKSNKRRSRPIAITLIDTQYEVIEQVSWDLNYNIIMEKDLKSWDIKWVDGAVSVDTLSKMQSHQKINHFPGMNTLSRKNNLAKNMAKMQIPFP